MYSSVHWALYTTAKTRKQPKCPSTEEWIKKMLYIYTMEYYSAIERNNGICSNMDGPRNYHATWGQSDNETPTSNAIPDVWNLKKGHNELLCRTDAASQWSQILAVALKRSFIYFLIFFIIQWIYYIHSYTMIITIQFYSISIPNPRRISLPPRLSPLETISFSKYVSQYLFCKEVHCVLFFRFHMSVIALMLVSLCLTDLT